MQRRHVIPSTQAPRAHPWLGNFQPKSAPLWVLLPMVPPPAASSSDLSRAGVSPLLPPASLRASADAGLPGDTLPAARRCHGGTSGPGPGSLH